MSTTSMGSTARTGILRAIRAITFPSAFGRALDDVTHAQAARPWNDREADAAYAPGLPGAGRATAAGARRRPLRRRPGRRPSRAARDISCEATPPSTSVTAAARAATAVVAGSLHAAGGLVLWFPQDGRQEAGR